MTDKYSVEDIQEINFIKYPSHYDIDEDKIIELMNKAYLEGQKSASIVDEGVFRFNNECSLENDKLKKENEQIEKYNKDLANLYQDLGQKSHEEIENLKKQLETSREIAKNFYESLDKTRKNYYAVNGELCKVLKENEELKEESKGFSMRSDVRMADNAALNSKLIRALVVVDKLKEENEMLKKESKDQWEDKQRLLNNAEKSFDDLVEEIRIISDQLVNLVDSNQHQSQ